jgi:hypothetical protein
MPLDCCGRHAHHFRGFLNRQPTDKLNQQQVQDLTHQVNELQTRVGRLSDGR